MPEVVEREPIGLEGAAIEIGETVYFRSGSPPLTIKAIDGEAVSVEWLSDAGEPQAHTWPRFCLERNNAV